MTIRPPILCGLAALGLFFAAAVGAQTPAAPAYAPPPVMAIHFPAVRPDASAFLSGLSRSERYTAQRKPRVAAYKFTDTNQDATNQVYSAAVKAMLVTYLKRKSQFVVVERENLSGIEQEWKLKREGRTNQLAQGADSPELLESIDAVLIGSITILHAPSPIKRTKGTGGGGDQTRIEIDVKVLGRADGRIIAAAKSSGEISCLRPVVERLGASLEQEFLRPYFGRLQFQMAAPENVRLFLTPILLDKALDEEKPPVEHGESVIIEPTDNLVESWTTNPTSYTVENLLSGWYTARIERPGYGGMGISNGNEDWLAREIGGRVQVLYRPGEEPAAPSVPLAKAPTELRPFVVYVHPRDLRIFDGDKLGLDLVARKQGGSLAPMVRRQHLDKGFSHRPQRVILIGKGGLELNQVMNLPDLAEDETCDLFKEKQPARTSYGPTKVAVGESFNFDAFLGGELIFEDYRGDKIPAGEYQIAYWEPNYEVLQSAAVVNDGDKDRPTQGALTRVSLPVNLETTGSRAGNHLFLAGETTGYSAKVPLRFDELSGYPGLPVDHFVASTDVPGLRGWRGAIDLVPPNVSAPVYDEDKDPDAPRTIERERKKAEEKAKERALAAAAGHPQPEELEEAAAPPAQEKQALPMPIKFPTSGDAPEPAAVENPLLRIKTRLGIGGRLTALGALDRFRSEDSYVDPEVIEQFDDALGPDDGERRKVPHRSWISRLLRREPAAAVPEKVERAQTPEQVERRMAREHLAERLEMLDLLILDSRDMERLLDDPETAAVVSRYLAAGGALYAFVSEPGDYHEILGTPFAVAAAGRKNRRFQLAAGEVHEVELKVDKKRVRLGGKRRLLQMESPAVGWRVLAFTRPGSEPRILEHGREGEGYAVIWLDRPSLFVSGLLHRRLPPVEENRAKVEKYLLDRTHVLSARRYGAEENRQAAQPGPSKQTADRLKNLEELLKQGFITRDEFDRKRAEVLSTL